MAVINYKNNEMKEENMIMRLWGGLVHFLEKSNLIPFVVVVSVYHYYQALQEHDPWFVAGPIALFVDLLHYRTVQQAAITRSWGWILTGLVTTIMAWGLQWQFYNGGWVGIDPAAVIPSLIVPLGVAIWAWHTESGVDWRQLLATAENEAETMRNESEITINSLKSAINENETKVNELQSVINGLRAELSQRNQTLGEWQQQVNRNEHANSVLKSTNESLQHQLKEASEFSTLMKSAPPIFRAALRYNANEGMTLEEALTLENLPASKKSSLSKLASGLRE